MNAAHLLSRFAMRDRLVLAIDRGNVRPGKVLTGQQLADLIDGFSLHFLDAICRDAGEHPCKRETWNEVASLLRARPDGMRRAAGGSR